MSDAKESELEMYLRMYRGYTEAQILENCAGCRDGTSRRLAADHVLRERADAATRAELLAIRHDVGDIRSRLRYSEWRTFTLWFALFAVIIAVLGLIRDYLNLQKPDSAPSRVEPATRSTPSLPFVPSSPTAPEPPVSAPAPADTKATAPTIEPDSNESHG